MSEDRVQDAAPVDNDQKLTPEEAAKKLNVTAQTLYMWRKQGIGPQYIQYRRRVFYKLSAVDAFIESCTK